MLQQPLSDAAELHVQMLIATACVPANRGPATSVVCYYLVHYQREARRRHDSPTGREEGSIAK